MKKLLRRFGILLALFVMTLGTMQNGSSVASAATPAYDPNVPVLFRHAPGLFEAVQAAINEAFKALGLNARPSVQDLMTGGGQAPQALVKVAKNSALGDVLVDGEGKQLYLFTRDAPGVSNCSGTCLANWPPLLTAKLPAAGDGITSSRLGTLIRSDGTQQVTYNNWPLYYYARDSGPGQATGQNVGKVWFVVTPEGGPVFTQAAVNLVSTGDLSPRLVDGSGRTLYLYTRDTANLSNCYGGCARNWPPLLSLEAPTVGEGIASDRVGTITRTDGTKQVTYNGWPLYYFWRDAAGDTAGQAVGNVWWALSSYGGPIQTSASVATVSTGDLGDVLVDRSGRSLYLFTRDTEGVSNCSGTCALNWPPVLTLGSPTASGSVNASLLGTIKRSDGTTQVTYMGAPLYYWVRDEKPGDKTGQNVGGVWFLVKAAGGAAR